MTETNFKLKNPADVPSLPSSWMMWKKWAAQISAPEGKWEKWESWAIQGLLGAGSTGMEPGMEPAVHEGPQLLKAGMLQAPGPSYQPCPWVWSTAPSPLLTRSRCDPGTPCRTSSHPWFLLGILTWGKKMTQSKAKHWTTGTSPGNRDWQPNQNIHFFTGFIQLFKYKTQDNEDFCVWCTCKTKNRLTQKCCPGPKPAVVQKEQNQNSWGFKQDKLSGEVQN